MHFTNSKYRLGELKRSDVKVCAKLLADIFLNHNQVWNTIAPTYEAIEKFMVDKTSQMLDWQDELRQNGTIQKDTFLNFTYLDSNDKIIGVWTNFELMQYLQKQSKVCLPQFEVLEKFAHLLEESINPKDKIPGKAVYGMFIAMSADLLGSGVPMLFWFDGSHYMNSKGFRIMYARSSNIKSFSLMMKFGGSKTAIVKTVQNGKQLTLSYIKWWMDPYPYVMHYVRQIKAKAKANARL